MICVYTLHNEYVYNYCVFHAGPLHRMSGAKAVNAWKKKTAWVVPAKRGLSV